MDLMWLLGQEDPATLQCWKWHVLALTQNLSQSYFEAVGINLNRLFTDQVNTSWATETWKVPNHDQTRFWRFQGGIVNTWSKKEVIIASVTSEENITINT